MSTFCLPPHSRKGICTEFARFEDLGNFHSFLAADMTWPYYIANNLPGRNSSVQKTESPNFYVEKFGTELNNNTKKNIEKEQ